jgi:hypothetical protein
MTQSLTKTNDAFSLTPKTLEEAMKYSEMLARSSIVPKNYQGKPGDILVAMQMGNELGLKPIQSLQNIAVINGKPCIYGDACMALVKIHPECEDIVEYYDPKIEAAVCKVKRRGKTEHISTFSVEQAKKAGLWGKTGPWTQYPQRMLQMRARGFALRDTFPDALQGLILAEEAMDHKDVTPSMGTEKTYASTTDKLIDKLSVSITPNPQEVQKEMVAEEPQAEYTYTPSLPEQLSVLIDQKNVPFEVVQKWLNAAGKKGLVELSDDELQKCIDYVNAKY